MYFGEDKHLLLSTILFIQIYKKNNFRSFSVYIARKKDGALSFKTNPFGRILVSFFNILAQI